LLKFRQHVLVIFHQRCCSFTHKQQMAIPALRVALSQLPAGSAPALAAVLRPATPRSPVPLTSALVDALAVAARQQPRGTPAASALAAASGRAFLRISRCAPSRQNRARKCTLDALAVAARQQPRGTVAAQVLAAASGRAFLRASAGFPRPRRSSPVEPTSLDQQVAGSGSEPAHSSLLSEGSGLAIYQATHAFLGSPGQQQPEQGSAPRLCQDTSVHAIGKLWPAQQAEAVISPRTFETRLRHSKQIFNDLSRVSAVSPTWAQHAARDGWPSAHAYLFQEAGTKCQLQARYNYSMQKLLVKDWLEVCGTEAPFHVDLQGDSDGVVSRIVAFLP